MQVKSLWYSAYQVEIPTNEIVKIFIHGTEEQYTLMIKISDHILVTLDISYNLSYYDPSTLIA